MSFIDTRKLLSRRGAKNKQPVPIPQQGWKGVNYVDEIYNMPEGHLPFAQNVDLGNPIGAITKCPGYEALFSTLGTGGIKGLHTWEHSDGDKLVAAWSNYLYLMSGTAGATTKTSQADWQAGTVGATLDLTTSAGDVKLEKPGTDFSEADTLTADFNGTHSDTVAGSDKVTLTTNSGARFYATATAAGYDPATERGSWDDVGAYDGYKLSKTKAGSVTYNFHQETGAAGEDVLLIKFVTDGIPADKTIGGTLGWCLGARENGANADMFYHVHAFVTEGDSDNVRGTLLNNSVDATDWGTTAVGLEVSAQAISDVAATAGDRIVIEVGFRANNIGGDYIGYLYTGGTSSTDLTNGGDATLYPGWFEFSEDPFATTYNTTGTYTHGAQDISGAALAGTNTITFATTTPAATAVVVQTRYTTDGTTYSDWTTRTSGDTVIPANTDISDAAARVQWRATLTSTAGADTPSLNNVTMAVAAAYETAGTWISPVYDITNTPLTSVLSWSDTEPAGTTVTWYARGSSDGVAFGDWQTIAASGDAIPLLRYVQVKFVMAGLVTATPTVSSLLLSYSTSYTQANRLDIQPLDRTDDKLTGNRVCFQDYDDRCYAADGLRPFVLYVDDDTVATGTSQNYVLNPSFTAITGTIDDDTEDTFTSWTNYTTGTGRTEQVTGYIAGSKAMKALQTDASAAAQFRGVYQTGTLADLGLSIGDVVTVKSSYKMSAQDTSTASILFRFRDAGTATISSHYLVNAATTVVASYTTATSEAITIPADTVDIQFIAWVRSSDAYAGKTNALYVEYISCGCADSMRIAAASSAVDDFYNNAFITLTGGTGSGQVRYISDYGGTSKNLTVSEAWTTLPDYTTTYSIGSAVKVREAGVDAPTEAPTLADSSAAGTPSGVYLGKYTFVNADGFESNPSPVSGAVTVSSEKITWTVPADASTGNTTGSRKLYRTKAGGAVYYYVATISDNTTTAYDDDIADASLTMLMLDNQNVPPVTCSLVYEFLTYMFYVNGDELWFSKAGLPEAVPNITGDIQMNMCPSTILDIKANPMALIPSGNNFIAPITTNSGFIFDSDATVDTTSMREIDKNGSLSAWASDICIDPNLRSVLVFPTNTGVRVLLPGLQEESIESIPLSRNIQPYFDLTVNRTNMAGVFFNQYYYLSMEYDHPTSATNEYITFVYDFRTSEWYGPWKYGMSCYAISGNKLYGGDMSNGIIYQMNTGSSFAGANIEMIADLPMTAPAGENHTYKFNKFMMMLSSDSVTTSTTVKPKIDERETTVSLGTLTDSFTGDERPGHNNIRTRKYRIPLARGSTLSYRITDDSTNPISIQKIITECTPLPLRK